MLQHVRSPGRKPAVPITLVGAGELEPWLGRQPKALRAWMRDTRFAARTGQVSLIAGSGGALERVVAGLGDKGPRHAELWDWAQLAAALPEGRFRFEAPLGPAAGRAALGWALASYRFRRYRDDDRGFATLDWPEGCDRAAVERAARATFLARDLINTPASDMGPAELAAAARTLAREFGARCQVTTGAALLKANYPAIHAVGRASARAPRLVDLRWGARGGPRVTLVGKGVCFDTGGLDLKSAGAMKLMKKDMGGAANVLGLAAMIMAARLPVVLRVLVPAVENSVAGDAMRPLDVIAMRQGTTVEIGNTDAEGRLILADALTEAGREQPELLVDFATLTGAARVALGPELPALFCNDDRLAEDVLAAGQREGDPLWRLPLWRPYRKDIEGKVADLNNAPEGGFAGAITAALFLDAFVPAGVSWVHVDLMAWNPSGRPGRPEGGEAQGMRALYALIEERFGGRRRRRANG